MLSPSAPEKLTLTPHVVGTGRSALLLRLSGGEQQREHFVSTVLQNIIVKSINIKYSMRNEKAVKREAKCHLFQMQTSILKTSSWIK